MGQAKRRGTFEERREQALAKAKAEEAAQHKAPKIAIVGREAHTFGLLACMMSAVSWTTPSLR